MRYFSVSPLLSLILLLSNFSLVVSAGGTIIVNSLSTVPLRDESGGLLSGNSVRVGTFDISGAGLFVIRNSNSFSRLDALFTPLAENIPDAGAITQANNSAQTLIINDALGQQGAILGQISRPSINYIAAGAPLYLWVFNHPNPSLATEWGIYSSISANWTLPDPLGSTTLSTASIDIILRGSLNNNMLLLSSNNFSYESWRADSFTDAELIDPTISSESSDPDKDGTINIAEYYYGTSPNAPDSPGNAFQVIQSTNQLELIWARSVNVLDVIAIPQTSPNLVNWQDQVPTNISATSQSFTLPIYSKKEFVRLRFQFQ